MARDYKNGPRGGRGATRTPPPRHGPAWGQLLGGLTVGLLVAGAVHIYHVGSTPATSVSAPPLAEAPPRVEEPTTDSGPRFEFYRLLPEMEVAIPDDEIDALPPPAAAPRPAEPTAPATPSTPARYLLQAGSFQTFNDADRLKAQLALIGIEANIQSVQLQGGDTWHRVRIGPLSDSSDIARLKERLESNGIDSILLRVSS